MIIAILFAGVVGAARSAGGPPTTDTKLGQTNSGEIIGLYSIGKIGNKEYFKQNETQMTWDVARGFCEAAGLQLGTIDDWQDYTFLAGVFFEEIGGGLAMWTAGRDVQTRRSFLWNPHPNLPAYFPRFDVLNAQSDQCIQLLAFNPGKSYSALPCSTPRHVLCQTRVGRGNKVFTEKEL